MLLVCACTSVADEAGMADEHARASSSATNAEEVLAATESITLHDYPVRVARSVAKDPRCGGGQDHLDEIRGYLQAIDRADFGGAVAALAEFQRRLYCLGLPGMRALDFAVGEAMRRAVALPTDERNRALAALFNPAALIVDQLMFTRTSYVASLMRLYQPQLQAALHKFPTDDIGMLVLRPTTGSLVRLPSETCSATACAPSEQQMLAMFADPRRFGLGVCNWLALAHNEWVCTAGVACGESAPALDQLAPADPGVERWGRYGLAHGVEAELRYRPLHGDAVLAHADAMREVTAVEATPLEKALWPVRSTDELELVLRSANAESEGARDHVVFGEHYTDADFMAMCGGVLEPVNMPWTTPPYDLFECLLDQRDAFEASVDCVGQGNAILIEEMRTISFDAGGGTGVLDPACRSNPLTEDGGLAPGHHFTCEDIPEFCEDPTAQSGPVNTEPSASAAEAAEYRATTALARAQARNDASVAADLSLAKVVAGSTREVGAAVDFGNSATVNFGAYNFGGGCEHATACYDAATHTIWVQDSAFQQYPYEQVLGAIVHEIMHAALTYLGVPAADQHDYIGGRGATVVEFGEDEEPVLPRSNNQMPAPDGNDCSVFRRAMDATLQCLDELSHPGSHKHDLAGFEPWKDPRKAYPNPDAPVDEVDECAAYAVGGGGPGGSSFSPCNLMHCLEPDSCWCADGGLPAVQLGGVAVRACGNYTDCGDELVLDPISCQCVPYGGLQDPVLPDNPLGDAWAAIDARLSSGADAQDVMFPSQAQTPNGLFPHGDVP